MINMWNEIDTDEDIEDFRSETEIIDDCTEITSLKYENNNLLLVLESRTFGRLEMFFEGVHHFSNGRLGKNYWQYGGGCYLEFRTDLLGKTRDDRLIMWTDSIRAFQKEKPFDFEADNAIVIAYKMKYRFIDNIDDTTEKSLKAEQSLKEIVEENHLIEITWDSFWNNFDDWVNSGEAEEYGITGRESIEAYLWAYALKNFGEDTKIIISIHYDLAESGRYFGYYDLVFDMNLEITDDFSVIV
ncbi:MAG: hypothetical protein K2K91_01185 [Ruminococcus sp.]|nr:hypothetical protein [Ruminococcus sp.]